MSDRPTVSVIIPNYNHANYLEKRLESIINQSFQDFELIILDDYSSDDSKSIIEFYRGHPKITHIVYNEKNSGSTFRQWKKGIDLAVGKYIWIAESDDYAEYNFLEFMIGKLIQNSNSGVIACRYIVINEKEEVLLNGIMFQELYNKKRWLEDYTIDGKSEIRECLQFYNSIPNASCVIFKTEYSSLIPELLEFKYKGDWLFWCLILKNTELCYLNIPLSYFRLHSQTTRSRTSFESKLRNEVEELWIIKTLIDSKIISFLRLIPKYWHWSKLTTMYRWFGVFLFQPDLPLVHKIIYHLSLFFLLPSGWIFRFSISFKIRLNRLICWLNKTI
ncbi:MAG: glycosyltransferase family 2 protein [Bacteroidetes bacterium]|nr:glycosyltransferase family 2 protein [Bacteroidota bacterium]